MKLGIVFPGQGSQQVGMLADLAESYSIVLETFAQASEVLGYDLWQLAQQGPAEKLAQTQVTQPLMLVAGVSVWRVWQARNGLQPVWLGGHSLGEYSVLVCAGALDFTDAVHLVNQRALYMKEAVNDGEGAMAAILGLTAAQVIQVCQQAQEKGLVTPANFNTPEQTVIGGIKAAVEYASQLAKAEGAKKVISVAMSVPSHCPLMQSAAEKLQQDFSGIIFRQPHINWTNNVDATTFDVTQQNSALDFRQDVIDKLTRQIYSPVRWVEVIQAAQQQGITHIVELGSGKVLTGLGKRIAPEITHLAVNNVESLEQVLEILC